MEEKNTKYTVNDFTAIDKQVAEMANREAVLTRRLKIENFKRLGIPLILLSCALAIVILALGVFIWLVQQERIVEVEKIVEITKEVPVISEKIKIVEVPVITEKIKIVEVPVYAEVPKGQISTPIISSNEEVNSTLGNLSLAGVERVKGSTQCVDSLSHNKQCVDTWKYENGAVYNGYWLNGQPHGKGSITFKDGGSISGVWLNGELEKVENEIKSEIVPLKSVTYFQKLSGKKFNSKFGDITVGHEFATGTDTRWKSAFCYTRFFRKNEVLRIDLSGHRSFNSKVFLRPYKSPSDFTKKQFTDAQKACPYSWSGFN